MADRMRVANAPSYKGLSFSDFYRIAPSMELAPMARRSAPSTEETSASSPCKTTLAVVVVIALVVVALVLLPRMMGTCGSGSSSRYGSARVVTTGGSEPIPLTSRAQLDAAVAAPGAKVVMFHASWCTHCNAALPKFTAASAARTCGTKVYKIDSAAHMTDADRAAFGIRGYPMALKFDEKGAVVNTLSGAHEQPEYAKLLC